MVLSTARIEIAMDSGDLLHRLGYSIFYPRPPSSAVVPNEKQSEKKIKDPFATGLTRERHHAFLSICYGATSSFRR
eukprot:scaffold14281_cov68-Attheya_sp.AAC.3